MLEKKQLYLANFNCTFGKEDLPLLDYFENIIYPAFNSEIVRDNGDKYHLENISLKMLKGEFVLTGIIVRRTTLDIKSQYNEDEGTTLTNEKIKSAPFSYFVISLKNHRMVLVKNQKGSPTVGNFATTVRFIINEYINVKNNNILNKEDKLPTANLNIVEIPFENEIRKELQKVKKIKKVILRFYPLNGDVDNNKTFSHLRELLREVKSKSGNTTLNTPDDKDAVVDLLLDTKGTVRPSVEVVYPNDTKRTLKDNSFSEKMDIDIDDSNEINMNFDTILGKVINKDEFTDTSDENQKIYNDFFTTLMGIYNS